MLRIPKNLPFLDAICWQAADVHKFTPAEMLSRYERGWRYNGVLADLEGEELLFVKALVQEFGSWLAGEACLNPQAAEGEGEIEDPAP